MERTVVGFDGSEHARKALVRTADLAEDGVTLAVVCAAGADLIVVGTRGLNAASGSFSAR